MSTTFKKQLDSLKRKRLFMLTLLFMFLIVIVWIGVSLFTSQNKLAISTEHRELAKPLSPIIDEKILAKIEQKKEYQDTELSQFPIYRLTEPRDGTGPKLLEIHTLSDEEKEVAKKNAEKSSNKTPTPTLNKISTPTPTKTPTPTNTPSFTPSLSPTSTPAISIIPTNSPSPTVSQ